MAVVVAAITGACTSTTTIVTTGATSNCSAGSGPSVCLAKTTFDVSESIEVQFAGGPGKPKDWIAVYPAGACNPTCPHGSTLWKYCATNTQTASGATVTSGSVTIDQSANANNWPLSPGNWEMLYLVDDGYSPIAKVSFAVGGTVADSGPACNTVGQSCEDGSGNANPSVCCAGLKCLTGSVGPKNIPYWGCSNPGCEVYDGVCHATSDCCGQLTCVGNICQL